MADEHAQILHVAGVGRSPNGGQKVLVSEHPSAARRQFGQQVVFAGTELDRLPAAGHQTIDQIDLDVAGLHDGAGAAGAKTMAHRHP